MKPKYISCLTKSSGKNDDVIYSHPAFAIYKPDPLQQPDNFGETPTSPILANKVKTLKVKSVHAGQELA